MQGKVGPILPNRHLEARLLARLRLEPVATPFGFSANGVKDLQRTWPRICRYRRGTAVGPRAQGHRAWVVRMSTAAARLLRPSAVAAYKLLAHARRTTSESIRKFEDVQKRDFSLGVCSGNSVVVVSPALSVLHVPAASPVARPMKPKRGAALLMHPLNAWTSPLYKTCTASAIVSAERSVSARTTPIFDREATPWPMWGGLAWAASPMTMRRSVAQRSQSTHSIGSYRTPQRVRAWPQTPEPGRGAQRDKKAAVAHHQVHPIESLHGRVDHTTPNDLPGIARHRTVKCQTPYRRTDTVSADNQVVLCARAVAELHLDPIAGIRESSGAVVPG